MKCKYQILWIDDEWDKMSSFITYCKLKYEIQLTPYKTQKEGLDAFAKNPSFWDAIILDAKVLDEDENEVATIEGLYKAVSRIQTEFKDIPYFISTGQPDLLSTDLFELFCRNTYSHRYYEKADDDDQLCLDILKAVQEKEQRKIKDKYPEIFSWLPSELYAEIMELLSIVESGDTKNPNVFNNIRKTLDWLMTELNAYGILGIEFSGTNLNKCSLFLSNENLQEFVPQYIQRQIHSCCTIANEGSHRLVSDNDVRNGLAPFLIRSTVFELLNILVWYHQLPADEDSVRKITNIAVSLANNSPKEDKHKGEDTQMPVLDTELNVLHCGDTMLDSRFWKEGPVQLFNKVPNTSSNPKIKEKYPFFAKFKNV